MWFYTSIQTGRGTLPIARRGSPVRHQHAAGVALAALALLALGTPRAQAGFHAPLAFDAGSNPVSVAVRDFNGDGILDMAVANHNSKNVSVLLGKGDGTFKAAVNYATGTGSTSVAVADLNGDGILDLAVTNIDSVSVLLGKGDGTFHAADNYFAGGVLHAVAVADFNGDGIPDLAVANTSSASVSVLFGNGDGTFLAAINYPAGADPTSVAVGDFNGDGIADLVVSNNVANGGSVSVLLGNGDGTFQEAVKYATGSKSFAVAVADLNGDGILDLAVANAGSNNVSVLLGHGDGTFRAAVNYAAGGGDIPAPGSVVVGDFNGDGVLDLAVASDTVSVLLGNGDGTFQAAVNYAAGTTPTSVAVGDFNVDGTPDLVVAIGGGNTVGVLLGQRGGPFQAAPTYSAGINPASVAVGDFNGDGIADVAVINSGSIFGPPGPGTVSILLGNGDGTFRAAINYAAGLGPLAVALGDFNGDGFLDLVVGNADTNVSVLLGNGDGTFRAAVAYDVGYTPGGVAVGDFNRDGFVDLAVCQFGSYPTFQGSNVSILLGNGDGSFRAAVNYATLTGANNPAVGDFNGDGIPDLVVSNFGDFSNGKGGGVSVLLGRGDGTFEAAVNYTAGLAPASVTVADLNGDGILDLAVTNLYSNAVPAGLGLQGDSDVSVLLGKGDGTFQAAVNYAVGPFPAGPSAVVVRDFNGDGIPDLAVVFAGGVRVLLGNGDGTFQTTPISYLGGGANFFSFPPNLAVGDFNGDGLPDLAVTNGDARNVSILLNDGKWGR